MKTSALATVNEWVFGMPMLKTKLAEWGTSIEEVEKFNIKN